MYDAFSVRGKKLKPERDWLQFLSSDGEGVIHLTEKASYKEDMMNLVLSLYLIEVSRTLA